MENSVIPDWVSQAKEYNKIADRLDSATVLDAPAVTLSCL